MQGKRELSNDERAQLYLDLGNAALAEGNPTGALQNFLIAEKENPSIPQIHHSKGLALYAKREMERAIASVRKAIQLKPDYSDAQTTLGKLLMDTGKYDEAISVLKKASEDLLYHDVWKPLSNLGIIYYRQGLFAQATEYLDRSISASPDAACVSYYYRGNIRAREGKLDEAIADYKSAIRRFCASFAEAQLALGVAYERAHRYEQARKKFLEIQTSYPNTKVAEQAMNRLKYLP
jgi:Tfp pilus assembly protein PilF